MSDRFRSVALALRSHISDTYALLEAADDVVSLMETEVATAEPPVIKSPDGNATYNWTTRLWDYSHEYLVGVCRDNDVVLMYLAQSKKINAIKELRRVVPGVGLRACKDAVEDDLVASYAALRTDPWGMDHQSDEPPF